MAKGISYESITTSRPITFKVGENGKDFFLPSSLVASLSEPLERLINGSFSEAKSGIIIWKDVDEATFVQFSQYAYTRTYCSGTIKVEDNEPQSSVPKSNQPVQMLHGLAEPPRKRSRNGHGASMSVTVKQPLSLEERLRDILARTAIKNCPQRRLVPSSSKLPYAEAIEYATFGDFILAHARVYVFADCYGIADLASEALYNVYHHAKCRGIYLTDMQMIITFCTRHTLPSALRDALVTYIATIAFIAWPVPKFQLLLKDLELGHEVLGMIIKAAKSQTPSIEMGTCSSS